MKALLQDDQLHFRILYFSQEKDMMTSYQPSLEGYSGLVFRKKGRRIEIISPPEKNCREADVSVSCPLVARVLITEPLSLLFTGHSVTHLNQLVNLTQLTRTSERR